MEKNYTRFLMDLDGTIIDSGEGVTRSVQYALAALGIEEKDRNCLNRFIGPPLKDSFRDFYGFTPDQVRKAIEKYRERYVAEGLYENKVYEGIEEILRAWKEKGKKVYVCTSKPEIYARKILNELGLDIYFDFIGGAMLDGTRDSKEEVMAYLLQRIPVTDVSSCVMIGDRKFDVLAAGRLGMDSIGVLYGYGDRAELEAAGATYIVNAPGDLKRWG